MKTNGTVVLEVEYYYYNIILLRLCLFNYGIVFTSVFTRSIEVETPITFHLRIFPKIRRFLRGILNSIHIFPIWSSTLNCLV